MSTQPALTRIAQTSLAPVRQLISQSLGENAASAAQSPVAPLGPTAAPTELAFLDQAMLSSNSQGQTAARGTAGYPYGPYLSKIPTNPFNQKDAVEVLANGVAFPAAADDSHGWIYKPETGEIRPDNTGTDDQGTTYYAY